MAWLLGALQYGPIGLAAIMLFLVVIALRAPTLSRERASLLRFFMITGSLCFLVACVFAFLMEGKPNEHMVYFRVDPLDGGSRARFPKPLIKINNRTLEPAEYLVKSEVTAIIDVNDAIDELQQARAGAERQTAAIAGLQSQTVQTLKQLEALSSREITLRCPFPGASGVTRTVNIGDFTESLRGTLMQSVTAADEAIQYGRALAEQ
ncbi:hypothetical protein [Agrobacterium sp. LAD9]|uniref:hypothetical protein n=1 Tax=Agrobacterium sp. LAD9 TaxID=2055153 RepID=UPI000D1E4354|nr:hypothetical protein [Agrobacterium sp. LAD9]